MNIFLNSVFRKKRLEFDKLTQVQNSKFSFPDDVSELTDINYCDDGLQAHTLNVYRPTSNQKTLPVIINVHGGGLVMGNKEFNRFFCAELCKMGYVVFSIEYRLVPEVQVFDQFADVTAAMNFIEHSVMADLKLVYAAPTEETALNELELFKDKWDSKYPKIYKSWNDNWGTLSTYFKYPEAVRRLIYTTNAIEGFNRQLRKVTKSKTVFPSDDSLLKMLYLATMDITKKWTGHRQDWGQIHSQLEIYFEERLAERNL